MKKLNFTKMVGSGNDFIIIKDKVWGNLPRLAKALCDRKFGIGADGLLMLGKSRKADISMRVFNTDGTEAEMCGNGARCAALFSGKQEVRLDTSAGVINAQVYGNCVKIQITEPKDIKLGIPIKVNGRLIEINFINTGVPHAIVFVNGIAGINVDHIGSIIRNHAKFSPRGTNVNFVEIKGRNLIRIRTYERGVEGETLACGTGSIASALIFALKNGLFDLVRVQTQSSEILKVYFQRTGCKFSDVWLEGSAKIVYKGEYYVQGLNRSHSYAV